MTEKELKDIVVFVILMQGNGGIVNKAPSYIAEKFESRGLGKALLDQWNKQTLEIWEQKWKIQNWGG